MTQNYFVSYGSVKNLFFERKFNFFKELQNFVSKI